MPAWLRPALEMTVVGLSIVFLVQILIALVVSGMRRLDERWRRAEEKAEAKALTREQNLDNTTVVLIAAAVATVVKGRHMIRSVRRLPPAGMGRSPWSAQGRAMLQGSHLVSRSKPSQR